MCVRTDRGGDGYAKSGEVWTGGGRGLTTGSIVRT